MVGSKKGRALTIGMTFEDKNDDKENGRSDKEGRQHKAT